MAVNIEVYPYLSPRIIEVLSPVTDVSVQELINAIRAWEDSDVGQHYPFLIDAAGKEALGGGVTVGITATLQNARIMFTGRTTALDYGIGKTCDLTDPLGVHLYVDDADFIGDGIYEGCTVFNATTGAMAAVSIVTDANNINSFALSGGLSTAWTIGDSYFIYPNVQCNIAGGNLVAVDDVGAELPSVFQTPNVQVVRSSSSSATLQELGAIQYSSFDGGVWLSVGGIAGTAYPIGTPETPSNNLVDAHTIADDRGFTELNFLEDWTFTSADYIDHHHTLIGRGFNTSIFTFETGSTFLESAIKYATVTGEARGLSSFVECKFDDFFINNTSNLDIILTNCLVGGTTKISPTYTGTIYIVDSWSIPEVAISPIFNFNDTACSLQLRNYSGFITLINSTDNNDIRIFLTSGGVELDSTCTDGQVIITGVGTLIDNSGIGMTVETSALINKSTIAKAVWDEPIKDHLDHETFGHEMYHQAYDNKVVIDVINGSAGTLYPIGTHEYPSNNLADSLIIANIHEFPYIYIDGTLTISGGEDISGFTLTSASSFGNVVIVTDAITNNTYFENLTVSGTMNGSVRYTTCVLGDINEYDGGSKNCLLTGNIDIVGTGANYFTECDTYITDPTQPKEISVNNTLVNLIRCRGGYKITNKTSVSTLAIDMVGGTIIVDSTCTAGSVFIGGITEVTDNSSVGCVVDIRSLSHIAISESVWDEPLTGSTHNIATTAGRRLRQLSAHVIWEGTSRSLGAINNQIIFDVDAADYDGAYDPAIVSISEGTGMGQSRLILEYEGATRTATVDRNWKINPDDTSKFIIVGNPGREHVNEGLAQDATSTTITLNPLASSTDGTYIGQVIFIRSGYGDDQARRIIGYDGTTKIATVGSSWPVIPDSTSAYVILPTGTIKPDMISNSVWNAQLSEHTNVGSAGDSLANVSAGADPTLIAQAVWDADPDDFILETIGDKINVMNTNIRLVLGLTQHNFRIKDQVYNTSGSITSSTIVVYDTVADTNDDVNPLKEYLMTAEYDSEERITSYKVIEA